jgi:ubiquinol-cytochrome c reductase cytochrome b subunit
MLMWHIVLLPMVVVLIVALHVLLVRRRGVVPPFASPDEADQVGPSVGAKEAAASVPGSIPKEGHS